MLWRFSAVRLKYRAIGYGCLVSYGVFFGGTILANMVAAGASPDPAGLQLVRQSAGFKAALFVAGLLGTVAGAYLAARLAPRAELANALAVGIVVAILALFNPALFTGEPDLLGIISVVLTIPAALAAGRLRVSRAHRSSTAG